MAVSEESNDEKNPGQNMLNLGRTQSNGLFYAITYKDNKYMQIRNIKGYNAEALLGQVGGFIGIHIMRNAYKGLIFVHVIVFLT